MERRLKTERGNGSMHTWYLLLGLEGVVQFMISTILGKTHPFDLGYHSYKPMYDGHTSMGPCVELDNADCYYDGSGLQADTLYQKFLETEDPEVIWTELENFYNDIFKPKI